MLTTPVGYLEISDFTPEGNIIGPLEQKPVFIMIQNSKCPACNQAKGAFQELSHDGLVACMTIQLDGERQSEKDIGSILYKIYPNIIGVPSFLFFTETGEKHFYDGDRSLASMQKFIGKHL
jgi:hypothetical protein